MTSERTLPNSGETLAHALRRIARRSHRALKQGPATDPDEVRSLLEEIGRSRGLADFGPGDELIRWLDRLEDQVASLIGPSDGESPLSEPSTASCGDLHMA